MRRYYLREGDKSTAGGVVTEGARNCTIYGIPQTYVDARVWCPTCNSEGRIVGIGPRWPDSIFGKEVALSDDICSCKCDPPPRMLASQTTDYQELQEHAAVRASAVSPSSISNDDHWIEFKLTKHGNCEGLACTARFADGSIASGVINSHNRVRFWLTDSAVCSGVELNVESSVGTQQSVSSAILNLAGI
ncbi:PAAR domain-containing protein [Caballeronia cordobensis]|uniref:PAAR domain-containing protein n=1 Tax=Caballeronia cordobensis TaxID=1353886 RepID=UPI00045EF43F|nr:uncharacterized protein BRPE67_BCDS06170 [Burkholderia sp. RPE67]